MCVALEYVYAVADVVRRPLAQWRPCWHPVILQTEHVRCCAAAVVPKPRSVHRAVQPHVAREQHSPLQLWHLPAEPAALAVARAVVHPDDLVPQRGRGTAAFPTAPADRLSVQVGDCVRIDAVEAVELYSTGLVA